MRKTADSKSLVPLTLAAIFRGVTIVLVPLVGLGSDQVDKANVTHHNVFAYHVDEHKFEDAQKIRNWLINMSADKAEHVSTILYMSLQSLVDKKVKSKDRRTAKEI